MLQKPCLFFFLGVGPLNPSEFKTPGDQCGMLKLFLEASFYCFIQAVRNE